LSLDRFKEFNKSEKKEFLYAFCFVLYKKDNELFEHFWQKSFLHYYSTLNKSSNITINYYLVPTFLWEPMGFVTA